MATSDVSVGFDGIKALASRTRYRILQVLADRRRTVSELADRLDVTKGTVHRHVQKLVDAGFVHRHEDERMWVYYELTATGEALAASERPRVVLRFSAAVVALAGALVAVLRAATLGGPTGGQGEGGLGGPGGPNGSATGTPPPTPPLEDPVVWLVVAAALAVIAVLAYVLARSALGRADR